MAFPLDVADLPLVNACLNGVSTLFLSAGFVLIRRRHVTAHRNCMLGAVATSALFLTSYLYYHFHAGGTTFEEPAWFRPVYLVILITHVILAMVIVPLVVVTLWWAARARFDRHRRIARWTWPVWMYVSVTGVAIYLLLYQIFPQE